MPGTPLPARGSGADDPANVLERITDLMTAVNGGPGKTISTPLAIAFTKLDTLTHDLNETSPLRRPAPQAPFFDEADSQAVHEEILQLLTRWDGARIDQIAGMHYRRYRYFGLSALGETPTADNMVSRAASGPTGWPTRSCGHSAASA